MNDSSKISVPPPVALSGGEPPGDPAALNKVNPLLKLHQLLRGRYHWAIILSLTLGTLGAMAGHFLVKNDYQSKGFIQIKPVLQKILYNNEQNNVMPMFDSYVDTQVSLMESPRIIEMAMGSATWKNAVGNSPAFDLAYFTHGLQVSHAHGTELIEIAFTDKNPQLAATAVKSVIEAYTTIAGENDTTTDSKTIQVLEGRRTALTTDITNLQNTIQQIANDYGTDDLEQIYQPKLQEYNQLEASLRDAEIVLANTPADSAGPAASQPAAPDQVPLTPELVARSGDEVMRSLLNDRETQERTLAQAKENFGPQSRAVQQAGNALDATNSAIADLLQKYKDAGVHLSSESLTAANRGFGVLTQKEAQAHVAELKALSDQAKKELLDIGRKELEIRSHQQELTDKRQELEDVKRGLDQRDVESAVGGRTSVMSSGEIPFQPIKDKNRTATVGGGLAGFLFGLFIVGFIGTRDRRLKTVADAELFFDRTNRILGILPALPEDLTNPEQASMAAYCVHHVRTLLQLGCGSARCPVIAVTSAAPGEGKTSLALSLGHSYAATGMKTLLIDCDIIGSGLSHRTGTIVHPKVGEILVRNGSVTVEQLDDALLRSVNSDRKIGETLMELGLIRQRDLDTALDAQRKASLGLLDVLDGEPLAKCMSNGLAKGLYILPMGSLEARHNGQMSLRQVQRIVHEARSHFDTVLIDTGPILGSLEACTVAAVADEVILVVSRGQERPLIDKAFARLNQIGAKVAGIVFNRATEDDVMVSAYSSQRNSERAVSSESVVENATRGRAHYLGPVAHAVALEHTPIETVREPLK